MSKKSKKSDLPFGSEFSPSQIDLPDILKIADQYQGKPKQLETEITNKYFSSHGAASASATMTAYNKAKLGNNCKLGLIAYGIIDSNAKLTAIGQKLLSLQSKLPELYSEFAKHILLNCKGMTLVQCLQDMVAAAETITLDTLRVSLEARGVHFPKGGKHPSIMRLWLEKAGVFAIKSWQINQSRLKTVLGIDPDEFPVLAGLSHNQRAFLLALANSGKATPQVASEIVKLAEATYNVRFPDKSLPKNVLNGLVTAGYIEATKTTSGRGAKPFLVKPTPKVVVDIFAPLLAQLENRIDPKLMGLLKQPLADVLAGLKSTDKYKAGLALEALAFHLMRSLAMDYVATRLRAQSTGGSEVDLIFHSSHLIYSRWQVQCKNTSNVALDDVAKEVGLVQLLKSSAIVVVTTGAIGKEARRYANKVMTDTNLAIVMLDGKDLKDIAGNPALIVDAFRREAQHAMALKKIEVSEGL